MKALDRELLRVSKDIVNPDIRRVIEMFANISSDDKGWFLFKIDFPGPLTIDNLLSFLEKEHASSEARFNEMLLMLEGLVVKQLW